MKTTKPSCQKAFTLIELLVVIAIIALLLSILVPALGRVKEYAWKVICANNIRSQALGVRLYAEQNNGSIPLNQNGNWFQDITFWCTNEIMKSSGVDYKSFFCPANKIRKSDDARFWQFSYVGSIPGANPSAGPVKCIDESTLTTAQQQSNFRVLAYNYMFDRLTTPTPPAIPVSRYPGTLLNGAKAIWITKISTLANCSSTTMIVDNTLSQYQALAPDFNLAPPATGCNFDHVSGGLATWGIYDAANHLARQNEGVTVGKDAAGGNTAYADGHVTWKNRAEIKCQILMGQNFWW